MSEIKRTKTGQRTHDTEVKKIVRKFERQGYEVTADLPGMEKPKKIGGKIPDVVATKAGKTKVVEVETSDSLSSDIDQRRKFRNWSDKSKKRTFSTKVVKK